MGRQKNFVDRDENGPRNVPEEGFLWILCHTDEIIDVNLNNLSGNLQHIWFGLEGCA